MNLCGCREGTRSIIRKNRERGNLRSRETAKRREAEEVCERESNGERGNARGYERKEEEDHDDEEDEEEEVMVLVEEEASDAMVRAYRATEGATPCASDEDAERAKRRRRGTDYLAKGHEGAPSPEHARRAWERAFMPRQSLAVSLSRVVGPACRFLARTATRPFAGSILPSSIPPSYPLSLSFSLSCTLLFYSFSFTHSFTLESARLSPVRSLRGDASPITAERAQLKALRARCLPAQGCSVSG